jgi:excisionase family DNA binding protein
LRSCQKPPAGVFYFNKNQKEVSKMEKKVYSVSELAQMLGLNMHTTYELVRSEGFPALRVGKKWLIPVGALDVWLNETSASRKSFDSYDPRAGLKSKKQKELKK